VRAGAAIRNLLELDLKRRDIMTREAFENAMWCLLLGGSTNAVLHLIDGAGGWVASHRRFSGGEQPRAAAGDFKPAASM